MQGMAAVADKYGREIASLYLEQEDLAVIVSSGKKIEEATGSSRGSEALNPEGMWLLQAAPHLCYAGGEATLTLLKYSSSSTLRSTRFAVDSISADATSESEAIAS